VKSSVFFPLPAVSLWGKVFGVVLLILMAGCASNPPTVVTKIERVYVTVPESMVQPCTPDRPMDRASYMALEVYDREREMAMYSVGLLKTIGQCNAQLKAIKNLQGAAP
jgi:hypothetical protein